MLTYCIKRCFQAIILLIGVSLVAFGMMHFAPGGPLSVYTLNPSITIEDIERIKKVFGLDLPVYWQYFKWAYGIFSGNWGMSYFGGRPVIAIIVERIPATLLLMGTSISIAILIGICIGLLGAVKRYSIFDYLATTGALVALSFPTFWFGLMAIYIFAENFRLLPSGGMITLGGKGGAIDILKHMVLPTIVLALVLVAQWSRYSRSSFLEVLNQDFMRTARSKGLSEKRVILFHALPNALVPLIALGGVQFPTLLGGALVVETIFSWPGMGMLFVSSLTVKDYPVLMGMTMMTAIAVVIGNFLADLGVATIDPRVRLG
jgi:peptide/nickel transport system permease protein